jgi:predicted esterase
LENGAPRFFRRLAEGLFDVEDLKFRTNELADFVEKASKLYNFDARNVVAIGYSNGANIATSILLLRPDVLSAAILFRPMVPLIPDTIQDLSEKSIFISGGSRDPIVPKRETERLADLFKESGANVFVHWEVRGHELGMGETTEARKWLSHFSK